jgi:hypothetical protein
VKSVTLPVDQLPAHWKRASGSMVPPSKASPASTKAIGCWFQTRRRIECCPGARRSVAAPACSAMSTDLMGPIPERSPAGAQACPGAGCGYGVYLQYRSRNRVLHL